MSGDIPYYDPNRPIKQEHIENPFEPMQTDDFAWYRELRRASIKEEDEDSDHLSQMGGSDLSNWRFDTPPPYIPPTQPVDPYEAGPSNRATGPRMRVVWPKELVSLPSRDELEEMYKNLPTWGEAAEAEPQYYTDINMVPGSEGFPQPMETQEPYEENSEVPLNNPSEPIYDFSPFGDIPYLLPPQYDNVYNHIILGIRDPPPKFGHPNSMPSSPLECLDRSLRETDQVKKKLRMSEAKLSITEKKLSEKDKALKKEKKDKKSFAKRIGEKGKEIFKDAKKKMKK